MPSGVLSRFGTERPTKAVKKVAEIDLGSFTMGGRDEKSCHVDSLRNTACERYIPDILQRAKGSTHVCLNRTTFVGWLAMGDYER